MAAWVNGKGSGRIADGQSSVELRIPGAIFESYPSAKLLNAGVNSLAAEATVQQERDRPPQAGFVALPGCKWPTAKLNASSPGPTGRRRPEQTGTAWVGQTFDDSSWPAAAVVAEIGRAPLGTPWPAQPVDRCENFSAARAVRSARIYSTALGTTSCI